MNFNIIAPAKNCSDFNVSFKEPITIEKDSKIQFNWAKFSRQNGIVLDQDADFFLRPLKGIPTRIPNTPATLTLNRGNHTQNKFTIPKGKYSAYTFQNTFMEKINTLISADYNSPYPATNGWNTQFYLEHIRLETRSQQGTDLFLGLVYDNKDNAVAIGGQVEQYGGNKIQPIQEVDANNGKNNNFITLLGDDLVYNRYTKQINQVGRTANTYDNYALSADRLLHYGEKELDGFVGSNEEDSDIPLQQNLFKFNDNYKYLSGFSAKALKDIQNIGARTLSSQTNENIVIGLYSREWANNADINAGTDKTTGSGNVCADGATLNPATTSPDNVAQALIAFMTIEIGQYYQTSPTEPPAGALQHADYLIIRTANKGNGANDKLKNMIPTDPIAGMNMIYQKRLSDITHEVDYIPEVFCHTYYKKNPNFNPSNPPTDVDRDSNGYLDEDLLYFRVGIIKQNDDFEDEFIELYDSIMDDIGFSQAFLNHFENTLGAGQSASQVNFQIPFSVIMSAQFLDDGWENLRLNSIPKETLTYNYDDNPITIVRGYQIDCPEFIGKMLNPFDTTTIVNERFKTKVLYPTLQSQIIYGAHTANAPWNTYIEDITGRFRFSDISIFLDSLPLENYKNIEGKDTRNNVKGIKKNLLANCPQPFYDGDVVGSSVSGFYSPFSAYITQLKNQEIKTNNLRFTIKESATDKPNIELETATIDFTIFK